jgi:hypothetical protein
MFYFARNMNTFSYNTQLLTRACEEIPTPKAGSFQCNLSLQ